MTGNNRTNTPRRQAIAAARRLESLIELTAEDDFLRDTLQSATRVIAQSGMMTKETNTEQSMRNQQAQNLLPV